MGSQEGGIPRGEKLLEDGMPKTGWVSESEVSRRRGTVRFPPIACDSPKLSPSTPGRGESPWLGRRRRSMRSSDLMTRERSKPSADGMNIGP